MHKASLDPGLMPGPANTALASVQAAELRAVEAEKTRRQQLYRAAIGEARARRTSGLAGQRYDAIGSLSLVLEAIPPAELSDAQRAEVRDEVVAAMALPDARVLDRRRGFSSDRFDVDCDDKLELHAFPDHGARSTVIRLGNDPATDRLLDPYSLGPALDDGVEANEPVRTLAGGEPRPVTGRSHAYPHLRSPEPAADVRQHPPLQRG